MAYLSNGRKDAYHRVEDSRERLIPFMSITAVAEISSLTLGASGTGIEFQPRVRFPEHGRKRS